MTHAQIYLQPRVCIENHVATAFRQASYQLRTAQVKCAPKSSVLYQISPSNVRPSLVPCTHYLPWFRKITAPACNSCESVNWTKTEYFHPERYETRTGCTCLVSSKMKRFRYRPLSYFRFIKYSLHLFLTKQIILLFHKARGITFSNGIAVTAQGLNADFNNNNSLSTTLSFNPIF